MNYTMAGREAESGKAQCRKVARNVRRLSSGTMHEETAGARVSFLCHNTELIDR
jgi:hypothetical protein